MYYLYTWEDDNSFLDILAIIGVFISIPMLFTCCVFASHDMRSNMDQEAVNQLQSKHAALQSKSINLDTATSSNSSFSAKTHTQTPNHLKTKVQRLSTDFPCKSCSNKPDVTGWHDMCII